MTHLASQKETEVATRVDRVEPLNGPRGLIRYLKKRILGSRLGFGEGVWCSTLF